MKKTTRKLVSAALCLAMGLSLAGCGGTQNKSEAQTADTATATPATATATPASAATPEQTGETRTVSTVMGDVEVPADPQRVVVNWYVGEALSAGLSIVGYSGWAQESMPFYDEMQAMTEIQNWEPEDVMALEPDLIITYSVDDFAKFSKVAPVLVFEESMSEIDRTRAIGEATGHEAKAEENIAAFEAKLETAKEALNTDAFNGKSFSINQDWGSASYGVYYETGSRGGELLYNYLGLQKPAALEELIAESGEGRGGLSYEVADKYFGDYIIWFLPEGNKSEYAQTEIWKSIPAVAQGHVLEIPYEQMGLFYYGDILSMSAQLDYIMDGLNALAA